MLTNLIALALVCLSPLATAAPTVEEVALKASLEGQSGSAISTLEREQSDTLRWIAGRLALRNGNTAAARRLLDGPGLDSAWGRIELELKDHPEVAAPLALAEMDEALQGTHRDAMATLLVEWAEERAPTDPMNAARFLNAALELLPSAAVRHRAEDALFRLPAEHTMGAGERAARSRTAEEPANIPARLRAAVALIPGRPSAAAEWLNSVAREGSEGDALAAATLLTGMSIPDPVVLDGLSAAAARFPESSKIAALRLSHAVGMATRDERGGTAALAALENHPVIGEDALQARARATRDPVARRAIWMELATRQGASALGDIARREALEALFAAVESLPKGEPRRAIAAEALRTADGAGKARLLYLALPDGAGRLEALWAHATRFPSGPWCTELADQLVTVGADTDAAERFSASCADTYASRAALLHSHAMDEVSVLLEPVSGGLNAGVSGAKSLKVSQHRVDPEALFRGTSGHPLDTTLDASLLEADSTWELPVPDGKAQLVAVRPKGGGSLLTLTVRAGDRRATALVVPDPLEVQLVRAGGDVAIAVLRRGSAVAGVELLVQDAAGTVQKHRTDGRGMAILRDQPSTLRIMAHKGSQLGFAISDWPGAVQSVEPTWSVVPWDRGVSSDGALSKVQVFGTKPVGGVQGIVRLESLSSGGQLLEARDVPMEEGVGRAEIFLQGGGSLVLKQGDDTLKTVGVDAPSTGRDDLRISFSDSAPGPGQRLVVHATALGAIAPEGLAATMSINTPWSSTSTEFALTAEGRDFEVDLHAAAPMDPIQVFLSVGARSAVSATTHVRSERVAVAPGLATTAAAGVPQKVDAPDGSWLLATSDGGERLWASNGSVTLPTKGLWQVCVWRDRCGPTADVLVVDEPVDAEGRWRGEPLLTALTAEGIREARILKAGDPLSPVPVAAGTRQAWVSLASGGPAVPVRGDPSYALEVSGALKRGQSTLDIGSDLPKGSRLWAFLRDASDAPTGRNASAIAWSWEGDPGTAGADWAAVEVWGEEIAAGLLQEEERLAEKSSMERMDFGFDGAAESGGLGSVGYGRGGGGMGMGTGGLGSKGYGRSMASTGTGGRMVSDPNALTVVENAVAGAVSFAIPGWVDAADLEVVARTPDGRWASRSVRLAVGGEPLVAIPKPARVVHPERWSGELAQLLPVARSLPPGSRLHALVALKTAGLATAEAPMVAALSVDASSAEASAVVARSLRGVAPVGATAASAALEGMADIRLAERADAAMAVAAVQPDRARAVATRLLREPELPAFARARAGLALWLAGDPTGAREALVGADPWVAAARVLVGGKAEPEFAGAWWRAATSEGAHPTERSLALHALSQLAGREVATSPSGASPASLELAVEPPIASWRGEIFQRQFYGTSGWSTSTLPALSEVPVGRSLPLRVVVPAHPLPTRLSCAGQGGVQWVELAPYAGPRALTCAVEATGVGALEVAVNWYAPDGQRIGQARTTLAAVAPRDSDPDDPMSTRETLGLGSRLGAAGDARGIAMLETLLASAPLSAHQTQEAATALLTGRRTQGDPGALINAFQAYRERVPDGAFDLETGSALAHAYAAVGQPGRAVAATQVVLDARFKEELGAVRALQSGGLELTALKLLRELLVRYPEVPTVVAARFLAPSMLLQRAEGDGDRLGYTRSSLRHTAAAELASFLLLHPDAEQAPEAAAMLTDSLRTLGDPERERALAGPLARTYRDGDVAWRLSLADARAQLAAGNAGAAVRILDGLTPPGDGVAEVELQRGRALDVLGKHDLARAAYDRSGAPEAIDRAAWLNRESFELPPVLVLLPGLPPVVPANLQPGSEVTVTAVRVNLEAVMLRDDGVVDPYAINVQGLRPAASRSFSVGKAGDVPLPALPPGAYLVTVVNGASTGRMVLVRTDAELVVGGQTGAGTHVHLFDVRGTPLVDAQLWLFGGGQFDTATTDGNGSAWVEFGAGYAGVLARMGDRYAVSLADPNVGYSPPSPSPSRRGAYGGLLEKNAMEYDALFNQDASQSVRANAL